MHLFVHGKYLIEHFFCTMERKSEITDSPCFSFLNEIVKHSVLNISGTESLYAAIADGMKQIIVDIVHLKFLERPLVHLYGILARIVREIRQLCCYIEFIPRMTFKSYTCRFFRPSLNINRRRVVIVHSMRHGIVNKLIYCILIYHITVTCRRFKCRPSHTAISQQ